MKRSDVDQMWRKLHSTTSKGRDHIYAELEIDGKAVARTHRSHGSGGITSFVQRKMQEQRKLTKRQFLDAVNCPLSYEDYLAILRDQGALG